MKQTLNEFSESAVTAQVQTPSDPTFQSPVSEQPESKRMSFNKILPWALFVIVLLGAITFSVFQYNKSKNLDKQLSALKSDPQKIAQDQTKDLIDKIGKLIVLPQGEQPTIATVTDLAPLKDQAFFATAEVGDKVLIFSTAKKAILYSEKLNKIKEVAPVNSGTDNKVQPTVAGDSSGKVPAPKQ